MDEYGSDAGLATFVLADYGDGILVFVPKGDGVDPRLQSLCGAYAVRP